VPYLNPRHLQRLKKVELAKENFELLQLFIAYYELFQSALALSRGICRGQSIDFFRLRHQSSVRFCDAKFTRLSAVETLTEPSKS